MHAAGEQWYCALRRAAKSTARNRLPASSISAQAYGLLISSEIGLRVLSSCEEGQKNADVPALATVRGDVIGFDEKHSSPTS